MATTTWEKSKASGARWSEEVARALGLKPETPLVFDHGEIDYQGCASLIAQTGDNEFVIYGWSYGSCSGCDSWEGEDEEKIEAEIRAGASRVTKQVLLRYLEGIAQQQSDGYYDDGCDYAYACGSYAPSRKSALALLADLK